MTWQDANHRTSWIEAESGQTYDAPFEVQTKNGSVEEILE